MANDIFRPEQGDEAQPVGDLRIAPMQSFVHPSISVLYGGGSYSIEPQPMPQQPMPQAAQPVASQPDPTEGPAPLPMDFGYDDEHPLLDVPFSLVVDGRKYAGDRISLMQMEVGSAGAEPLGKGGRYLAVLKFTFDTFAITLTPEVTVVKENDATTVFQFANPTGDHLPQLRYILNSVIAGDFVTIDGMVSYTGPTEPKKAKAAAAAAKQSWSDRVRSIGVAVLSATLIVMASFILFKRYTTAQEMHPVFIERAGQQMRATAPGQISYLNPAAKKGEVVYAINANTGDVLNFQMPCDCEVVVTKGLSEGATVLQTDLIMTIFVNTSEVRAQTLMSIEGLTRAMNGDMVTMDLNDGRSIPVKVIANEGTTAASMRGDLYVPVELEAEVGALTQEDIGKSARLRLSKNLLGL